MRSVSIRAVGVSSLIVVLHLPAAVANGLALRAAQGEFFQKLASDGGLASPSQSTCLCATLGKVRAWVGAVTTVRLSS